MSRPSAEVLICGAGIAGISTAYHLAVRQGMREVLIVDERPPLSLTSDKSTECYRNWWPGPGEAMVSLMNRSIDLLEELAHESGNVFHLNRRGYLYLTAQAEQIPDMLSSAQETSLLGAGPLRILRGTPGEPVYQPSHPNRFDGQPEGADLILSPAIFQEHFPYVTSQAAAALHARRAGWFSAQQLGMYLFEQAKSHGVELKRARVVDIAVHNQQVLSVSLDNGSQIKVKHFVDAAGPFVNDVASRMGVNLPVFCELHLKAAFKDRLNVLPREAPLLIWNDPQFLIWSDDERELLTEDESFRWMLSEMPAGAHTRPEGPDDSPIVLMLWEYRTQISQPVPMPLLDPEYPEIALRGLIPMIPGFEAYLGRLPRPVLDGGYYTKTRDNRLLVGPLSLRGAWVIGALSGYGLMASLAAGELLAMHLTGTSLPGYAQAFDLRRFQDPAYLAMLDSWTPSGQL
jgi:glycine/D-amino acid oxidase-like deaminating enzyme